MATSISPASPQRTSSHASGSLPSLCSNAPPLLLALQLPTALPLGLCTSCSPSLEGPATPTRSLHPLVSPFPLPSKLLTLCPMLGG